MADSLPAANGSDQEAGTSADRSAGLGPPAAGGVQGRDPERAPGSQISEHDALVATKVATILCGGDRAPDNASEQHFLDLEREVFLSLRGTQKTLERIQYTPKEGKPLRK